VIVLGVPMLLPIVESTPSINHTVLYDTTNTLLDHMAFRLEFFLNNLGHTFIFMPREGYSRGMPRASKLRDLTIAFPRTYCIVLSIGLFVLIVSNHH